MKNTSNILTTNHKREDILLNESPKRKLEDLNMIDAFLFDKATASVKNAITISKVIIKRATGLDVQNIVVETEKQIPGMDLNKRGVRLDVYLTEEDMKAGIDILRLFDIEPNNYYEPDLPRRSRFYQSLIDSQLLPTDTPFRKLPDIFMIWILPYDPFGDDRMIYTVKNMVVENNQIVYNDGSTKLFLYTKGTKGGSKELKDLLTYMEHTTFANAVDSDLKEIQEIVDNVKADSRERERFMTLQEMIYYEKRDSREAGYQAGQEVGYQAGQKAGIQIGLIEGIKGVITAYKSLNATYDQAKEAIIKQFDLTEEKADEYIHLYWQ